MPSAHSPPPGAKSIDQILEIARSKLTRLTPDQLHAELESSTKPIHIIDIRPSAQRDLEALFLVPPTCDSQCEARLKDVVDAEGYRTRLVVICSEGYTSSLAAVALQELGLQNATDLVGGQKAWERFRVSMGKSF
ncbi:hypothetical protein BLS_002161 [Venturia inaequalis]|uniref:Rhodanese domain-containing protein n=1 Tax=Venturia inaequalis TaxID=5025 RepID=A0A8H3UTT6_VENIN|nr:hypothetical protein BLS_002161 [Venturia inaequalis]KAE9994258.1 hypothetical protein EG327_000103 [Venturia inaequalis]